MKSKSVLRAEFDNNGFVFIADFLSKEAVEEIRNNVDSVISEVEPNLPESSVYCEEKGNSDTLKQLMNLHIHDRFFEKKLNDSQFKNIATVLLEDKIIGKNLEYFNKRPKIGKPTPPHQDGYYFMLNPSVAVTMWMGLETADEENGCVQYIKGSHLKGMRRHGKTNTLGLSQQVQDFGAADDKENTVCFPANPGDLLIHHSLTVHFANGNKSATRSRNTIGLVYFGESAKENFVAKAAY